MDVIDGFLEECASASNDFLKETRGFDNVVSDTNCDMDDESSGDPGGEFEAVEKSHDDCHNRTTIFLNKYCEDIDSTSIANRLADAIVHFEVEHSVPIENEDDFEIDNEIVDENEYLKDMKQSIGDSRDRLEEDVDKFPPTDAVDEFDKDLEAFSNPSKDKLKKLSNKAKQMAQRVQEKVSVAPGEHGSFQNWGDDAFLEEKAFPHLFPFGVGGYLSSCIDDPDTAMGFANYCVNQLMSCDPKFREDSSYIFFLLLGKLGNVSKKKRGKIPPGLPPEWEKIYWI